MRFDSMAMMGRWWGAVGGIMAMAWGSHAVGQDGSGAVPFPPFSLEPARIIDAVAEVVVTATRVGAPAFDTAADVTSIPASVIGRPGTKNFREALSFIPGVRIESRQENTIFSELELRGLNSNWTSGGNVLILLDGVPQRRLSFGGPYMGALPVHELERMELVKGPVSAQYGRGSLAGALQLFTDSGGPEWEYGASVSREEVTRAQWSTIRVSGPLAGTGGTFSLTGTGYWADGWQPWTEAGHERLTFHLDQPIGDADRIKLICSIFDGEENVAGPVLIDRDGERVDGIEPDTNLAVPSQNSIDITEIRAALIYAHDFAEWLGLKATGAYWNADTFWKMGRPSDAPAMGTLVSRPARNLDWREDSWFYELQLQYKYEVPDAIEGTFTLGGTWEYYTWRSDVQDIRTETSSFGQGIPIDIATMREPDPDTWVYGIPSRRRAEEIDYGYFLSNQTTFWKRFDLSGAFRWDYYRRYQRNEETELFAAVSDSAVTYTLGGLVRVVDAPQFELNLYSTWGTGFNPIFRAVSSNEIVALAPEKSESIEAGLKFRAWDRRIEGSVTWYSLERNDVVGWNPTAATQQNLGDWEIDGIEVGASAKLTDILKIYATFTDRNPRVRRNLAAPELEGRDIAFVASRMVTCGCRCSCPNGLSGEVEGRFVDQSYADDANRITLPDYWVMDASLSYRWRQFKTAFFAKNLLDEEYYSSVFQGVVNGSAFEGTPRTFGVTLSADF